MLYRPIKIGNVLIPGNLFLAPVAGYSDRAFRGVCKRGGADFTYTEMVSAEALVRGSEKTSLLMLKSPEETQFAVQLFGGNADVMGKAVDCVLSGKVIPDVIDINAGCPVPKIVKTGAGSALTRDPERLYQVTLAAVKSCTIYAQENKIEQIPVTVKIRSGWDSEHLSWKEAAHAAIEAGAAAVTLHGRTRAQGYEGLSDWSLLAELSQIVAQKTNSTVPVFGSGDVFSPEAAKKMLEQTNCSGVMFARGALGNPFVFIQTRQLLQTGSYEEISPEIRIRYGMDELRCLITDFGEESACRQMRKRFCAYSKGLSGGALLREKIVSAKTESDYVNIFSEAGFVSL